MLLSFITYFNKNLGYKVTRGYKPASIKAFLCNLIKVTSGYTGYIRC